MNSIKAPRTAAAVVVACVLAVVVLQLPVHPVVAQTTTTTTEPPTTTTLQPVDGADVVTIRDTTELGLGLLVFLTAAGVVLLMVRRRG